MELVFIIGITLLLVPLAVFTTGVLRIVLGLSFLLFFPGYTLLAALFPRKESLDAIQRIALSFGLSVAIVPMIGLILNYTPWGIRLYAVMVSVVTFIIITSAIALYRRRTIPKEQRFEPHLHIKLPQWNSLGRLDRVLSIVLVLSIVGAIGSLVYIVAIPRVGERDTEFYYVLRSGGTEESYPLELVVGEEVMVTLGIVNQEHKETLYHVEVRIGGGIIQEINDISLPQGQKWGGTVTLVPRQVGEQKAEFLLYNGEGNEPYRVLGFWLDVKEVPA